MCGAGPDLVPLQNMGAGKVEIPLPLLIELRTWCTEEPPRATRRDDPLGGILCVVSSLLIT
jgi:hypothetical protein